MGRGGGIGGGDGDYETSTGFGMVFGKALHLVIWFKAF